MLGGAGPMIGWSRMGRRSMFNGERVPCFHSRKIVDFAPAPLVILLQFAPVTKPIALSHWKVGVRPVMIFAKVAVVAGWLPPTASLA